jgi:hypothetical protein
MSSSDSHAVSDEESVGSFESHKRNAPKEPPVGKEDVFLNMSKAKAKLWFDTIGTKPILKNKEHFHAHALLAASRYVLEADACKELAATMAEDLLDVGASPARTEKFFGHRGRFLCPQLQPGDAGRLERAPVHVRQHLCEKK